MTQYDITSDKFREFEARIVAATDLDTAGQVARDIYMAGIQAQENKDHAATGELRMENQRLKEEITDLKGE